MRDSKNNRNKYGVHNNRNVTHQIILNIDNTLGSIGSPENKLEDRISSRVHRDNSRQHQGNELQGHYAKGKQGGKVPPSISLNLYATTSSGKIFTDYFCRSKNHNFGLEVRIQNSTSCVYSFIIAGCIYDSNGEEIYRWKRTTIKVPPNNSPAEEDFWVDRNKFLAMRDGKYKVQLWINGIKVVKMFFTVLQ